MEKQWWYTVMDCQLGTDIDKAGELIQFHMKIKLHTLSVQSTPFFLFETNVLFRRQPYKPTIVKGCVKQFEEMPVTHRVMDLIHLRGIRKEFLKKATPADSLKVLDSWYVCFSKPVLTLISTTMLHRAILSTILFYLLQGGQSSQFAKNFPSFSHESPTCWKVSYPWGN